MTTLTIKINERSKKGKAFLSFAKTFFNNEKDVEIVESDDKNSAKTHSPYNLEFVKMVLDAAKSKKRTVMNSNDIFDFITKKEKIKIF